MSEIAHELLERFLKNARKIESPHDSEWSLFYEFVGYCHDHHVNVTEEDLLAKLQTEGFVNRNEIAQAYRHIRDFMRGIPNRDYKVVQRRRQTGRMRSLFENGDEGK